MNISTEQIGFIGLGVMGEPICARLSAHSGKSVLAYDLDAKAVDRIKERGVRAAASLSDLIDESDVVFLSLPSGEVVSRLARSSGGLFERCRSGQVIVDLSTSAVESTRTLAREFAERGVFFVDAPVARTRAAAEAGTLLVMVGASADLFAQLEPLLSTFATDVSLCGEVGCGQVLKILNNMVLFEVVVAIAEAKAIGTRAGVDPALLLGTLTKGSADSFALRNHGLKAILPNEYPTRAFSVRYARKDLHYALDLAEQTHVRADSARHVGVLFDMAVAQGLGENYWPVISTLIESDS